MYWVTGDVIYGVVCIAGGATAAGCDVVFGGVVTVAP